MADNKDKKVLNVPALRFPEFTGEWENITIREACSEFQSGKNIKAEMINDQGLYPVYGGNGLRGFTGSYNHDGDYILIGRQGALCGNVRKVTGKTYVTEHAIAVCASKEHETTFLQHLFQKMRLGQYSDQSAQPGLAVNKLLRLNINVPSKNEQGKIAKILSLIDERITTQNKIIEKLETLIKGIIETVISSQKPNTLIKNCLECNSSTLQESQVAETGTFPVYGATGISGYTEAPDVNGESILIIKDGSGVGTVKYVTGEYSYIGTLNSLTAKDGYCLKFIYFALQKFCFEPYKTGMAIPHIYFKDYGKAKIFCPTIKEQFAIAKRISMVEDKVSVEKRIFFHYQAQKSYLLSQMLI